MTNSAVQSGEKLLRAGGRQTFKRRLPSPAMAIAAAWLVLAVSASAHATTIERVVSPGGVKAWLVHEPAVP